MGGAIDLQKRYKKRRAPLAVRWQGAVSHERPVLTGREGEGGYKIYTGGCA